MDDEIWDFWTDEILDFELMLQYIETLGALRMQWMYFTHVIGMNPWGPRRQTAVGRLMTIKDIQTLIFRIYEYQSIYSKKNFADTAVNF